jgi:hypothetical protein
LGYTLYGGTAIALHLGHRESVDFDFFTDRHLDEESIQKAMPIVKTAQTIQREPETWTMIVRAGEASTPSGLNRQTILRAAAGILLVKHTHLQFELSHQKRP